MSEISISFFTKFPVEFMEIFSDLICRSIPQVREGNGGSKNLPRYSNYGLDNIDNEIEDSGKNLTMLLSVYDAYLLDSKTYCRQVSWKCIMDAVCVFETSNVDGEITIVLVRLALLNLFGALRLLSDADFFNQTAKIEGFLKKAVISFMWASRKADHPKFDGYNKDKCIFKKYHFLRAFSKLSEALLYLVELDYNCEFIQFASDNTRAKVADALKAATSAILFSAGTSSDSVGREMAFIFSVVHKSCDILYQTLSAVQSFSDTKIDSEENAIIYVTKLQTEAQKQDFKNLESEIARVAEWLLKVKKKSLGIIDTIRRMLDDVTTKFPVIDSNEPHKPTTSDVFDAVDILLGGKKQESKTKNNKSLSEVGCSICHTTISPDEGYMYSDESSKSAHLLCFCIQSTNSQNINQDGDNTDGNFSAYARCASKVWVNFPSCSHGNMSLKTLLVAGDRRRIFFCDECTGGPASIEDIINDWALQRDLSHSEALKVAASKSRPKTQQTYGTLHDALEQNADPAYVKETYDSGQFGYTYNIKLTPVKELCIMRPDLDVVATLTSWGYTVSEMIFMGLNYEMAISGVSFKTLIMHRDISPAPVLASQSFQFTAAKMLLAGVRLSDIANTGYILNDLAMLKLTARVFVAGGGDEATLRKLLKDADDVPLGDFLDKDSSDSPSHGSIRAWLRRAHFTTEILSLL
jgi:hypothetical protein